MSKICNVCGNEFDDAVTLNIKTTDDGTEYCVCSECEKGDAEYATSTFYICEKCGFPHDKEDFKGMCIFCGESDYLREVELNKAEELLLDTDPNVIYVEKLGKDVAKQISQWSSSTERKSVDSRHDRDRHIDTVFAVGIFVGYFLLEYAITTSIGSTLKFLALLALTALTIAVSPVFKYFDKKAKKPLPIWSMFVAMAVIVDIYILIIKFLL